MIVTKSRKYHAHLEDPAGTEYLEDVALGQRGKSGDLGDHLGDKIIVSYLHLDCLIIPVCLMI